MSKPDRVRKPDRARKREAFICKMLIEGLIINIDTAPLEEIFYEMHKIGTNINQIAKVANTNGSVSQTELQELKERADEIWHILKSFQSNLL